MQEQRLPASHERDGWRVALLLCGLVGVTRAGQAAFGALALWLLSPALTSVHVEGFTAQIQIGAIAANAGLLDHANLLYPIHAEYFYLTRLGVVYLLQALMWVTADTGDLAFRVLTLLSFVALVACTLAIARRRSEVGIIAPAIALLLTPGIAELAFHFNDNVVSAAFGMAGLAVLPASPAAKPGARGLWVGRGVLAGAAVGFATLARTDALLLLPVAAGLAWLNAKSWWELFVLGALVAAGLIGAFLVSYAISGSTIVQSLQIARFFDAVHADFRSKPAMASVFVLFFGLPNLALLPAGAYLSLRKDGLKRNLVLIALPLLLLGYMVPHSLEARQFYPLLAPFIAIHGGRGVSWIIDSLSGCDRLRGWAAMGMILGVAVVWLAPPVFVPVKDGPRAVLGRIWSPILWFEWQAIAGARVDDAGSVIGDADQATRIAVVTTQFNTDHYLRLRLWQHGYRPMQAQDAASRCVGGFEDWHNGGHELIHVRTENPHIMDRSRPDYLAALQIQRALRCRSVFEGTPVYVSDHGPHPGDDDLMQALYAAHPDLMAVPTTFAWPEDIASYLRARLSRIGLNYSIYPNRTVLLTKAQTADLSREADRLVSNYADGEGHPLPDYDQFMAPYGYHFWRPRGQTVQLPLADVGEQDHG